MWVAVFQSLSWVQLSANPWTEAHQASLCFTTSGICLNSCPLSRWCYLTISSSVAPFSCPQSSPVSWSFASGGQRIGASASASALPVNIQGWFPLGLTGFISLLSKGLSRAFSSTITQKHWFFSSQLSLWSSSHIHNDYWKNHSFGCIDLCWQPVCFLVYCLGLS